MDLRDKVTKLAEEHPELRKHLVPLLKKDAAGKTLYSALSAGAKRFEAQVVSEMKDSVRALVLGIPGDWREFRVKGNRLTFTKNGLDSFIQVEVFRPQEKKFELYIMAYIGAALQPYRTSTPLALTDKAEFAALNAVDAIPKAIFHH